MSVSKKKQSVILNNRNEYKKRSDSWQKFGHFRQFKNFEQKDFWETRIFGAMSLIIIGIVLFLNATGALSWSIWLNFLKFWPLFLVSLGISIIFSGSRLLKFLGAFINFIILLVIFGFAIYDPVSTNWFFFPSFINSQTQESSYTITASEFSLVKTMSLKTEVDFGQLTVKDSNSQDYLNVMSTYYVEVGKPLIEKSYSETHLAVNFTSNRKTNPLFNTQNLQYDLELGQSSLPTDLMLKFGAGSGTVNLSRQKIRDLQAEVGAGTLELNFTEAAVPDGDVQLSAGLGNIKLTLPKNIGLKLNYKVGLGSLTLNNEQLAAGAGNGNFTNDYFKSVEKSLEINVEVGLGSIEIYTK